MQIKQTSTSLLWPLATVTERTRQLSLNRVIKNLVLHSFFLPLHLFLFPYVSYPTVSDLPFTRTLFNMLVSSAPINSSYKRKQVIRYIIKYFIESLFYFFFSVPSASFADWSCCSLAAVAGRASRSTSFHCAVASRARLRSRLCMRVCVCVVACLYSCICVCMFV